MPSALFRRRGLVAILAVALVTTGGLAYAAIPDAGGVIHTCYTKSSGAWRVIDTGLGQTCKSNEAALDLYSKGGADLAFLAKTGKAADSELLDGQDSSAFLGSNAKAADSDKLDGKDSADFLGANATAADSEKLGGLPARVYVLGRGVLIHDAVHFGGVHRFGCCDVGDVFTPRVDFALSCDAAGGSTLEVSSIASFRWWWDETSGEATLAAGRYEAEFAISGGADRHSLRALLLNAGTTANLDLDTWIDSNCLLAFTLHKAPNDSPGP
jgi:hypothetical protein